MNVERQDDDGFADVPTIKSQRLEPVRKCLRDRRNAAGADGAAQAALDGRRRYRRRYRRRCRRKRFLRQATPCSKALLFYVISTSYPRHLPNGLRALRSPDGLASRVALASAVSDRVLKNVVRRITKKWIPFFHVFPYAPRARTRALTRRFFNIIILLLLYYNNNLYYYTRARARERAAAFRRFCDQARRNKP